MMAVTYDYSWEWPLCSNTQRWSELFQEHRQCPMYTQHASGVCAGCRRERDETNRKRGDA